MDTLFFILFFLMFTDRMQSKRATFILVENCGNDLTHQWIHLNPWNLVALHSGYVYLGTARNNALVALGKSCNPNM